MKNIFLFILTGISISLFSQISVVKTTSINYNDIEGIPFTKGYSGNFAADSYCFNDFGSLAVLSNSDLKIRFFDNTGSELLSVINLNSAAKEIIAFGSEYVLLEKDV
ncbi:MAG: hypothetical protein JXR58_01180, partial [Bacteroidales bacterium]|nr:hypothetical protein [Bacteroidales bacterium]